MENGNRPSKKPFLKKGTGKARILQRNVINIRPKTAETGDSGVRDINLQISPTYDFLSIRTTVTTYEKESPPKVPIETESNGADEEAKQYKDEKNLHAFQQLYSTSAKQLEGLNLKHGASTSSRTVSYTSLNQIQTPPIQNKEEENEYDESNYSAQINAASRSTESASVGTSHVSHEPKNNDSQESEHGNFSAITKFPASALRSVVDPNLYLYGTSYRENQSLSPDYTGQFDNITAPSNTKNQSPFFKGRSTSLIQYTQQKPLSYLSQKAQRLGIIPEIKYILPPHPKALESPDVANEFRTPKSKKYISFFNTPLLPKTSVNNEERKVLESLAEQLRALLILIDVTLDGKKDRMNKLKYIYSEKAKALEKKEKEMKEKTIAEEKKLMGAKAKLKLEIDKMKQTDGVLKKLESELKQVKTKYVDTSRILSNYRTTKNLMEEKLKKAEEELQKEKEKAMKWELLNSRLKVLSNSPKK
uniref:Uncharacterized protein n=1 Tax=Panagrolaimus davidi TaxID=227884 RepID=A0A914R3B5_9BILA